MRWPAAAVEAGAHVYVQKPTSVDVRESEAMLDAARRHNRVVQVGMQRRSTPHLIEAKKNIVDAGLLGKVAYVDMCCYYHMRANEAPEPIPVPEFLDYDMWTGPAPLRPYDHLPHRGWWRAFMEYSNGIVGDMGVQLVQAAVGFHARVVLPDSLAAEERGLALVSGGGYDAHDSLIAISEISTTPSLGRRATCTASRAGKGELKLRA